MNDLASPDWVHDAIFYHIYPLGLCGAPPRNDFIAAPSHCLERLCDWIPHIAELGCNALWLGPVFESSSHGYDTVDYARVDRRLGDAGQLRRFVEACHAQGIRVLLDGVFNHVGRDFFAFRDLREKGRDSRFASWFKEVDFSNPGIGDGFSYRAWRACSDLVELNLANSEVREYLFEAVSAWFADFAIDGLRLDAADSLDLDFQRALATHCREIHPGAFLVGEVIHGDYRRWMDDGGLDAVTNYEAHKGLWSSFNDGNLFEIAYALKRQFGAAGVYCGRPLHNFVDNHDVERIGSRMTNPAHLYPLHVLLYAMPGNPSVYYGSEWGIAGHKEDGDAALRPALDLRHLPALPHPELAGTIRRLAEIRQGSVALRRGDYREVAVAAKQLTFERRARGERVLVVVNAEASKVRMPLAIEAAAGTRFVDLLNPGWDFRIRGGVLDLSLDACWGRILREG